jgi:hypothetical protein
MILFLVAVVLLAPGGATGQDFTPMKGSATPSFEISDENGRCLVFGTNIVKTTRARTAARTFRSGIAKARPAERKRATSGPTRT